jgi:hypothetical protein
VKPVSKPVVLVNLLQALSAIVLGNVAYFFLSSSLPLPRHRPFQLDAGLVVDFFFCAVAYGLIRMARRWKRSLAPAGGTPALRYFGNLGQSPGSR